MLWDPVFMMEAIANPSAHNFNHSMVGKILNDSPANRYSFVCNVLMDVCVDHRDPERWVTLLLCYMSDCLLQFFTLSLRL